MTVEQYIKKHGWNRTVEINENSRAMNVDINFEVGGVNDETEFSIEAFDVKELSTLFSDFCRENQFPTDTVTCVTIVETAESMEDLS